MLSYSISKYLAYKPNFLLDILYAKKLVQYNMRIEILLDLKIYRTPDSYFFYCLYSLSKPFECTKGISQNILPVINETLGLSIKIWKETIFYLQSEKIFQRIYNKTLCVVSFELRLKLCQKKLIFSMKRFFIEVSLIGFDWYCVLKYI